jgi:hypothetical protein
MPPLPETVATDIPCLNCSYNLRTLSLSANCPECGQPVFISFRGDLLIYAPKRWLTTVTLGCRTLTLGLLLPILCYPLLRNPLTRPPTLLSLWALNAIGLYLITRPEPNSDNARARTPLQLLLMLSAVLLAAAFQLEPLANRRSANPWAHYALQFFTPALLLVPVALLFAHLHHLARRVDPTRGTPANVAKWITTAAILLLLLRPLFPICLITLLLPPTLLALYVTLLTHLIATANDFSDASHHPDNVYYLF